VVAFESSVTVIVPFTATSTCLPEDDSFTDTPFGSFEQAVINVTMLTVITPISNHFNFIFSPRKIFFDYTTFFTE
jgi:hypothetical protein